LSLNPRPLADKRDIQAMKAPPGNTRRGLHIGTISDAFIGILSAGQQWPTTGTAGPRPA